MKADERVTKERLAEKIRDSANAIAAANIMFPEVETTLGEETLLLLRELQSRRAAEQAALPAVEEMAESIAKKMRHAEECREHNVGVITSALAPLYAKLAEYAEVLGECRDKYTALCVSIFETPFNEHVHQTVKRQGVAFRECDECFARIDALLGAKGGEDALR